MTGVPARPAAYIRGADGFEMTRQRDLVLDVVQSLGWPVPAVYAHAGPPGHSASQLAALVEAISAGRHDAVFAIHPRIIGDLDQIEIFDRLCRQHGNSDIYRDIAEILGLADGDWQDEVEEDWPPPELAWRFLRLHVETAIALQIVLATGEFRAGRYARGKDWNNSWRREAQDL